MAAADASRDASPRLAFGASDRQRRHGAGAARDLADRARAGKLTTDDIYWGAKLACLEMVKTGTTTFLDMYFHMDQVARAAKEMGLRAFLAEGIIDLGLPSRAEEQFKAADAANRKIEALRSPRITPVLGPHTIYTVSEASLRRCREIADDKGYHIHIHLSETKREVDDSVAQHGMRPTAYLDKLGFLAKDVIAAHGQNAVCAQSSRPSGSLIDDRDPSVLENPVEDAEEFHAKLYKNAIEHMLEERETTYHVCQICGYVADGSPPDQCPVCNAPKDKLVKF